MPATRLGYSATGRCTSIIVPCPGVPRIANSPCSARTRWRIPAMPCDRWFDSASSGSPTPSSANESVTPPARADEVDGDPLRLRVLEHVGQRFLHDPVDRDRLLGRQRVGTLVEVERAGEAGALAGAAHEPVERGAEPEVVEQRRAQVLDDAALHGDAVVERLEGARESRLGLGIGLADRLADGGDVHLRADQDAAHLVVQLAGDARLLVLAHRLQVVRQLGELGGALVDDLLEARLLAGEPLRSSSRCAVSRRTSIQTTISSRIVKAVIACEPMRMIARSLVHRDAPSLHTSRCCCDHQRDLGSGSRPSCAGRCRCSSARKRRRGRCAR